MTSPPTGAPAILGASRSPVGVGPVGAGAAAIHAASPAGSGDVSDVRELAELLRDAVLAVPGVAGLHGGAFGTVATYLPGRRVLGVAVREGGSTEISVIALASAGLTTDLRTVAARVHHAAASVVPGSVHVTVADLATEA